MSYDNRQFIGLHPRHRTLIVAAVKKARERKGMQTERGKDGAEAYAYPVEDGIIWKLYEPPKHLCTARGISSKEENNGLV